MSQANDISEPSVSSVSYDIDDDDDNKPKVSLTKATGPQFQSRPSSWRRCEFTQTERKEMVRYVVECQGYEEMKGTALWKRMSRKFPHHTWQSLKEHFLKKIMPLINSYNLPADVVHHIRNGVNPAPKRRRPPILNAYSEKDDNAILKYVQKHGKNAKLGGNTFWQNMEERNIIPGRSWHSIRQRYLKHLQNKPVTKTAALDTSSSSPEKEELNSSASSNSSSENENSSEKVEPKKRRKLFTMPENPETPSANVPTLTPNSVKPKKPSMLDILRRNNEKAKLLEKRQVPLQESDKDESEGELIADEQIDCQKKQEELMNDEAQQDESEERGEEGQSQSEKENIHEDDDEAQSAAPPVEAPLPNILDDAEHPESDESDWSFDGLYNRGTIIKYKDPNFVEEKEKQSVTVCENRDLNSIMEAKNHENIAEGSNFGPSECTENNFDFLGDMTRLSQLSEKTNRATQGSVFSQKVDCDVALSGQENSKNSIENGQVLNESLQVSCEGAESERSAARSSSVTFNPSFFSTQNRRKLTEHKAVQMGGMKQKKSVATQTDPVLVLPVDDGSEENIPQLLPNQLLGNLQECSSTAQLNNSSKSVGCPSPVPATFNTMKKRRHTCAAARDSESDEGLSPKFTPPSNYI